MVKGKSKNAETPTKTPKSPSTSSEGVQQLKEIVNNQAQYITELEKKLAQLEHKTESLDNDKQFIISRLDKQEDLILKQGKKIQNLEANYLVLESKMVITSHVNDALSIQIDDSNQYSRRNCIIINGIPTKQNETVSDVERLITDTLANELNLSETAEDVDRAHRIGPIDNNNNQQAVIVKFKSFKHRTAVYTKRKDLPKPKKVSLSLTSRRQQLLKFAHDITEDIDAVHFCFYDINCCLKIRLRHKVQGKYAFNTKEELKDILAKVDDTMLDFDKSRGQDEY